MLPLACIEATAASISVRLSKTKMADDSVDGSSFIKFLEISTDLGTIGVIFYWFHYFRCIVAAIFVMF